jgi:N-acetylglucosaminyldiphosphoundecaprenol N-acetyl-beta-D-mannosaminyltransferase
MAMLDPAAEAALKAADILIPDGVGVVLASKILGGRIRERITGSDVFHGVNEAMNRMGQGSCFFLGATEDTLVAIRARMAVDFPNVRVAGTCSPLFKSEFTGFSLSCSETKIPLPIVLHSYRFQLKAIIGNYVLLSHYRFQVKAVFGNQVSF